VTPSNEVGTDGNLDKYACPLPAAQEPFAGAAKPTQWARATNEIAT
jgi:hypothetical protein